MYFYQFSINLKLLLIGELLVKDAALFASLTFSRAHEYQADLEGWQALVKSAGYNPMGMISVFETLKQLLRCCEKYGALVKLFFHFCCF